jgi:hypothetical protein
VPGLEQWWPRAAGADAPTYSLYPTLRETLITALQSLPPSSPLLVLATYEEDPGDDDDTDDDDSDEEDEDEGAGLNGGGKGKGKGKARARRRARQRKKGGHGNGVGLPRELLRIFAPHGFATTSRLSFGQHDKPRCAAGPHHSRTFSSTPLAPLLLSSSLTADRRVTATLT